METILLTSLVALLIVIHLFQRKQFKKRLLRIIEIEESKTISLNKVKLMIEDINRYQKLLKNLYNNSDYLKPSEIQITSQNEKLIFDAVQIIDEQIDNPNLSVKSLSDQLGISSNYLYRGIKDQTGQTVKEFIRTQRLKAAASLIEKKKCSISEATFKLGFTSPSYFTRCFKNYYGCTPTEYTSNKAS